MRCLACWLASAAFAASPNGHAKDKPKPSDYARDYPAPFLAAAHVGILQHPDLEESSGVVASRQHPGVFWSHNDQGHAPRLYAFSRTGQSLAHFDLDLPREDWEDIAADSSGHLYLGAIGNNNGKKTELKVHRLAEPDPTRPYSAARPLPIAVSWRLRFPAKPFDAECLFVDRHSGFLISKVESGKQARLYRFPLRPTADPLTLEAIGRLPISFPATGADLSPDSKQLAIVTDKGFFLFDLSGGPATAVAAPPSFARLPKLAFEGICFAPDGLILTAESRQIFLCQEAPAARPTAPHPGPAP